MEEPTDEARRKEIFRLLVKLQDEGLGVGESRETVAMRERLSIEQVKEIERAGIEHKWPPLD